MNIVAVQIKTLKKKKKSFTKCGQQTDIINPSAGIALKPCQKLMH